MAIRTVFHLELTDRCKENENATSVESFNPYKPLSREEIIERLEIARKHADADMIKDAHTAVDQVREEYGLR